MDYLEKARRVIRLELAEIERLLPRLGDSFNCAVEMILACVDRKGKVVVCGVGKSGHIGDKIAATLTSTGCPASVLHASNATHGDLGIVGEDDVVLALSYSGETDELVGILPAIARLGVPIIAITGNAKSFLAQNAQVVLDTAVEQEACPLNLAPTASTTVMLVLGDALAMVLLEARGFTREDFARYHPGGKLGRTLLLKVEQIMRPRERMAVVAPSALVREVLQEMTSRRAGAAVAIDSDGRLSGIFTHGDFARHYQANAAIGDLRVEQFLTRSPITVLGDKLAMEVLHILETHRIDDLVVVDAENRPIGIVDTQDLARHRLL
jgi:arabinose-5-phosphate isomerase